jgi:hypothetical protein
MRLRSIFRYAQLLIVALLMTANSFGMPAARSTFASQHCVVVGEHHHQGRHGCGPQSGCCSMVHCCPILQELATVTATRFEPGRHGRMQSVDRPLLLIRSIDPPPRFQVG